MRNNLSLPSLTDKDIRRIWKGITVRGPDDCWEWGGYKRENYGRIRIQRKLYGVTRLVYFLTENVDPGNTLVLHTCDNPSCCNPKHLWSGDDYDNNHDKEIKGRGQHPKGEANGVTNLTEEHILIIRQSKETNVEVGKRFGVTDACVSGIRLGKTWKHVGGPITSQRRGRPPQIQGCRTLDFDPTAVYTLER